MVYNSVHFLIVYKETIDKEAGTMLPSLQLGGS